MKALSIRQPHAEQILRGKKKIEYRNMPTNKRERVYIYASKTPADHDAWDEIGRQRILRCCQTSFQVSSFRFQVIRKIHHGDTENHGGDPVSSFKSQVSSLATRKP
jgi:hypothetical protein